MAAESGAILFGGRALADMNAQDTARAGVGFAPRGKGLLRVLDRLRETLPILIEAHIPDRAFALENGAAVHQRDAQDLPVDLNCRKRILRL